MEIHHVFANHPSAAIYIYIYASYGGVTAAYIYIYICVCVCMMPNRPGAVPTWREPDMFMPLA